jgi:ubiquinone/menaquinone biosynthesis C-methylase UbiE
MWSQWLFARAQQRISRVPNAQLDALRRRLFADLAGTVVEIGPGTGPNLRFYPPDINLIGIEPNPHMHPFLRAAADEAQRHIDIRRTDAERMDLPDASVDAVVATRVLCSVHHVSAVLREVQRVLRPGGRFVFIEHVAAPRGTRLRRVQRFIRPLWRAVADGCSPDRETWVDLERAGFASIAYERVDLDGRSAVVRPVIAGSAECGQPRWTPR